eukprot:TRINITY_DN679_c0_g1_i2.p2 TRINITY_DN679_c0_g1~~TRINITY_DN679_c0_g1_i2.p2  ORF type:complete len:118 (+),score=57.91 TRINITY_DN679_c0_g1_i2:129-482(+)
MIRRPPRSTQSRSSAASDVYKRQGDMIPKGREKESEGRIKGFLTMMDSMTFDELDGIDSGRAKRSGGRPAELKWQDERIIRVARGSGRSVRDVVGLLEERKRMALSLIHISEPTRPY